MSSGMKAVLLGLFSGFLCLDGADGAEGDIAITMQPVAALYSYEAMRHCEEQWLDTTFWTGPDWTRVGKNWQHPGSNTASVRCFVVPKDGHVIISGCARKADTGPGDGVQVSIRHEASTLWQATLAADDATGLTHAVEVDVRKGEVLRFIVHRLNSINCDSTYWDPEISYTGGPRFCASEGFDSVLQDAVPWRYEMETTSDDPNAGESAISQVYTFSSKLLSRSWNLEEAGIPIRITSEDCLPFVIVTQRRSQVSTLILMDASADGWELEIIAPDTSGRVSIHWNTSAGAPQTSEHAGDWYQVLRTPELEGIFREAFHGQRTASSMDLPMLSPALWGLVTEAWLQEDGYPGDSSAFQAATVKHLDSCMVLAEKLTRTANASYAEQARTAVGRLIEEVHADTQHAEERYVTTRRIKRELLLRRPEFNFDQLLFCKRVPPSYSHLVMQYLGWRARAGGGLFVLERPGYTLDAHDLLDGQLVGGSVLQPCLDWDGQRVLFSYVEHAGRFFQPQDMGNDEDDGFFHLWTVNTDGSGLRQLTQGAYEDLMPAYLPDGDIVFCSTRRKGYSRCFGTSFGARWNSYTLHRLDAATGDIDLLSSNDVSEWFPAVGHDGLVYYSRWDYIDRDAVTHQNLWSSRPDGTNPMAVWGNGLPNPHCTFQIQPIPGSHKFVFTASAHHSITGGSLVVLDTEKGENAVDAMQRITPSVPFPESESLDITEWYAAPWPLAEDLFLTAYSPYPLVWEPGANRTNALGIYILDAAGNRELLYRDLAIGSTNPIPLRARPRPPVVSSMRDTRMGDMGEFFVADVYEGLEGVVERGAVKELRVVQIFPKITPYVNTPPVGLAGEENTRAVLGTVPVAPDGSVRFKAPANKALLFQLLDADGRAVQVMRSLTYLQPGERVSCVGCHEGRGRAVVNTLTEAGRREPSSILPGPYDGQPFSYMRVVQPVLDRNCVSCHGGEEPAHGIDLTPTPDRGFTRSYYALMHDVDGLRMSETMERTESLVPRYEARNQVQITPPGGHRSARGSGLLRMLDQGHQQVSLSDEEMRQLAMWIDCNALFYGSYLPEHQEQQLAGEVISMPEVE